MALGSGSVNPERFPDEVFDLYSIPAFDRGTPEVVAGKDIGSTKQVVEPGDVLLSKIVPHIRRTWVVGPHRGRRIIASGEWIVFRGERIHPGYVRHVLVGDPFHAQFMRTVTGVGGSLLRARPAHVAKIAIPLPSHQDQQRIADILDRADALRAKRRAALALLDALMQSIFVDMFGDVVVETAAANIGDVADVQGGLQVSHARAPLPVEVPYLRVANVSRGELLLDVIKTMRVTPAELERTALRADDLLVVEGHGNPAELGRCALWRDAITPCVHQNHLIRVRPRRTRVEPRYLHDFLNSPVGRRHLIRAGNTTSGLNTISVADVRATPLILPAMPRQVEYAHRMAAVDKLKAAHRVSLAQLDALFASLQHRAFRGEL